jgi:hypothetical protein
MLPCKACRQHYQQNLAEHPIDNYLNSRKALVCWLIDIHNRVNVKNGKSEMSYEDAITLHGNIYKKQIELDAATPDSNLSSLSLSSSSFTPLFNNSLSQLQSQLQPQLQSQSCPSQNINLLVVCIICFALFLAIIFASCRKK